MSTYFTYATIIAKVEMDLDLEDEIFVQPTEMLGYANEAVREAEAEILTLYEDYFLSRAQLGISAVPGLVSGTEAYDLPTNCYAHKIRSLVYRNGASVYPLKRFRDWKKFAMYTEDQVTGVGNDYSWFIDNSTVGIPKVILSPNPTESGDFVTIWYIRNANRFAVDGDICDIPEFVSFVIAYIKTKCYEKEVGHPNLPLAHAELERHRKKMVETLTAMTPDNDNQIEPDISHYQDMT